MDREHIEEIKREEARELKEEPFRVWIEDNESRLIDDFIDSLPPEEQPLDDDTPDFIDNNIDDFEEFCKKEYKELI